MGTAYSEEHLFNSLYVRGKCDYSITNTDTTSTVSVSLTIQTKGTASGPFKGIMWAAAVKTSPGSEETLFTFEEDTTRSDSITTRSSWTDFSNSHYKLTGSKSFTKTHSAQTASFSALMMVLYQYATNSGIPMPEEPDINFSVSIPAKTSYTVSYNANSGSGAPSSQTKWYGENLTLSSTKPTRTNYTFYHWNTNTSNTGTSYNAGATYSANSAATLYAIWNPTISYNANGGSGAPSAQTKTYGVNLTLSTTIPTRANHEFLGWATSASGTVAYSAGGTYSSNDAVTLYAVWKELTPNASITSVIRCDSTGTADILGGCLKVEGTWEIINQSAASTPTITASGLQTKSDSSTVSLSVLGTPTIGATTFSLILGNPPNHSGSPSYVYPQYAASVTVNVSDTVTTKTVTSSINASESYVYPSASLVSATRKTSSSVTDALGGCASLSIGYSMLEATAAASQTGTFPVVITTAGYSYTENVDETDPIGTITHLFGNGTLADFPPDSAIPISVTVSDYFATTTTTLYIPIDSTYHAPTVGIASYTRCNSSGAADDLGGYLKLVIMYNFYDSASRKAGATLKAYDGLTAADIDRQIADTQHTYGMSLASADITFGSDATWTVIMPYAPYDGTSYEALIDAVTEYVLRSSGYDGYKTTTTNANVPVSPYTAPAITELTVYRCDEHGNPEDDGMLCAVEVTWSVYPTISQTGVASLTLEAINPQGVVEAFADVTSQTSGTSGVADKFIFGDDPQTPDIGDLSQDTVYQIRVKLYDILNETVKSDYIYDAFFPLDFLMGGHGVSFGKPAHQTGFNVSMEPYTFERLDLPVYSYTAKPAEADVPYKPCIVIDTSDNSVYLYYEDPVPSNNP